MKKLALGVATALTALAVAPGVFAVTELGSVEGAPTNDCMIGGQTPTPTISPANNVEHVTVAYDVTDIKYVDSDPDVGRTGTAAWLGIKVNAPKEINSQGAAQKVNVYIDGKKQGGKTLYDIVDNGEDTKATGPYFTYLYGNVTAEKLEEATKLGQDSMDVVTWGFDWDGDDAIDQDFTVTVNTTGVTLYGTEGKGSEPLFTPEEATANIEAYEKAQAEANRPATTPEEENANPNTADPVALYATIAVVALVGLGATALIATKARR